MHEILLKQAKSDAIHLAKPFRRTRLRTGARLPTRCRQIAGRKPYGAREFCAFRRSHSTWLSQEA
jgi:hypothetical protein